ncbi:hypothetical protein H072_2031 [Dactylellina haptotyla CBS 200.50]|uniref:C2H2-type domain-containing protein n=1 Tax=Dactylellina haptotyla (strain CBS 200.50) TaxID=1284197 RepID=S8C8F0_DACHA|nr:hypothetical protein H072_2031 [Dactylellina haptotyla CBS 200.50]
MPSLGAKHLHKTLLDTIDAAPEHHVKLVLQTLCTDPKVVKLALEKFAKLKALENPKKRKAPCDVTPILPTCTQCKETFDESDNTTAACVWHPGNREVDFEAEVWDEVCNSDNEGFDFEDEQNVEEYPEGYRWDCCDEYGDCDGCREGPHKAVVEDDNFGGPKKRVKWARLEKVFTMEPLSPRPTTSPSVKSDASEDEDEQDEGSDSDEDEDGEDEDDSDGESEDED